MRGSRAGSAAAQEPGDHAQRGPEGERAAPVHERTDIAAHAAREQHENGEDER